ncbi:MAG: RNA polymerase sigma-70 factor [Cyclobacteriaceae bacterium]
MKDFPEYSDAELWGLVEQSNHRAFDEIYRRYWQKVYREANKVLRDADASSDLTQEVFVNLWSKRSTTSITHLPSYLSGMTRNQVFKYLRNGKIAQSHLARITQITSSNHTEQMVDLHQLEEMYSDGLASLPDRCREVFRLSRSEQLSTKEIATRLNISPKTVENQITKALKHLKAVLRVATMLVLLLFS